MRTNKGAAGEAAGHFKQKTVKAEVRNLIPVIEMIKSEDSLSEDIRSQLHLIAEEIFVNICSYAYKDRIGEVTVSLEIRGGGVTITFTDSGQHFDPTADVVDIETYDHEHAVGGLGRYLAFEIADEYSYTYQDGKNILTITKKIN